ncbi:MAG: hypothetical protein GY768_03085 [Planctomycetaceae bacterium]|nr:hypothetical protein [Planctomycetaceae bacterium]
MNKTLLRCSGQQVNVATESYKSHSSPDPVFKCFKICGIASRRISEIRRTIEIAARILQAQPDIDAVYCFNDEMAMGALSDKLTLTAIPSVLQFSLCPAP